jgi:hypothetical protein
VSGLSCKVVLSSPPDADALDVADAALAAVADRVDSTRKGRVWKVLVSDSPIHVAACDAPPGFSLSTPSSRREDYEALWRTTERLAAAIGGVASQPAK